MVHSASIVPAVTAPQTPSKPDPVAAAVQAWQRPAHEVLQQTPLAQKPEEHWLPRVQGLPLPDDAADVVNESTAPKAVPDPFSPMAQSS